MEPGDAIGSLDKEGSMLDHKRIAVLLMLGVVTAGIGTAQAAETGTPPQLVETYESLADTILGAKKTEWNLVHSLLAMTYRHAEGTLAAAKGKLAAGQGAKPEIEKLAALVTEIASEGDARVAAVRKRLVEGGHHHNAEGEKQGIYDEGFVIVTRAVKKALLDAAGKVARATDAAALDAAWKTVEAEFGKLHAPGGR
jgi:hypothetical protein